MDFNFNIVEGALMCSIVMPADYEMLVSHSPPVYSHSPPNGFLTSFRPFSFNPEKFASRNCRTASCGNFSQQQQQQQPLQKPSYPQKMPSLPIRSCLVYRPEDHSQSDDEHPVSPTRCKKKVVFADDKGMSLTHVRVMTEPSNVPPIWTNSFLSQVTKGLATTEVVHQEQQPWEVKFQQPASDYVAFRKKLEMDKVSLENVIVKEGEEHILGTVKVSNMAFHKEVFVRWTSDGWKTHEDVFCQFVTTATPGAVNAAYSLFDTFSFRINLPPKCRRIEFCVCFRCEGQEYWDNNRGENYVVVKKTLPTVVYKKSLSADDLTELAKQLQKEMGLQNKNGKSKKCADALQAKMDTWSEFASWTHLENSSPYCQKQCP